MLRSTAISRPAQRRFFLGFHRLFSRSCRRCDIRDIAELPARVRPSYHETNNDLLSLKWPSPPRNVLLIKKESSEAASEALLEFAQHISSSYPGVSILLEPYLAKTLHSKLPFDVYSPIMGSFPEAATSPHSTLMAPSPFHNKVDMVATFGGDGTILHASSLFSSSPSVPPILSFSMGTLGFLGEYKFADYKKAFREAYFSGASHFSNAPALASDNDNGLDHDDASTSAQNPGARQRSPGWDDLRGKHTGKRRGARVLLRNRLKVAFSHRDDASHGNGNSVPNGPSQSHLSTRPSHLSSPSSNPWASPNVHRAMNEVLLHRGAESHLMHISVHVNGRLLTEAVADGMLVSTPTGSTAYSLSAGGSIVHPLVPSLLLTPVCPRSLSFRPLVLPANAEVLLTLGDRNRGREIEVSVDGDRWREGASAGMEVRVTGEHFVKRSGPEGAEDSSGAVWEGGVPCLIRGGAEKEMDDGWVGGLNGLLKWNYPFGEEAG